jgi:Beta-glucan synthesis-associated protein SKN1/KRE6/Sbg1
VDGGWETDTSRRRAGCWTRPEQSPKGSGVGQRLIPEEPMSIGMNLGMSGTVLPFLTCGRLGDLLFFVANWQTIDLSTLMFPWELPVDYVRVVRVYQRKGEMNIGCNSKDYPTADYINNHREAYGSVLRSSLCLSFVRTDQLPPLDANATWSWPKPRNRLVCLSFPGSF